MAKYNVEHIARAYSTSDLDQLLLFAEGVRENCDVMVGTEAWHTMNHRFVGMRGLLRTDGTIADQIRKLQKSMTDLEHAIRRAKAIASVS